MSDQPAGLHSKPGDGCGEQDAEHGPLEPDDEEVAQTVIAAGYDPYEKKLLGVTAMTSLLGKKRFDELLGGLLHKPQGKPTLVSKSDKRPAMRNTAENDFKGEE